MAGQKVICAAILSDYQRIPFEYLVCVVPEIEPNLLSFDSSFRFCCRFFATTVENSTTFFFSNLFPKVVSV